MRKKSNPNIGWRVVYQVFKNYFDGNPSDKEREIVETWKAPTKRRFLLSKQFVEEDRRIVYTRLSHQFDFEPEKKGVKRTIQRFSPRVAVAASLLLVLGLGATFWLGRTNLYPFLQQSDLRTSFETNSSSIRVLTLADGSIVRLNRGSKLEWVENQFNRKQREVWLEGEAFFEVTKNAQKPFIVHSGALQTTVRGTSFNIKAYPQLDELVVSVRTGKVEVGSSREVLGMLTPDKELLYHSATGKTEIHAVDAQELLGWMAGKMVLSNASIEELRLRLKQFYGLNVNVNGTLSSELMFNASFKQNTPIREVLQTICSIYSLQYDIKDVNNVTLFN